MNFMDPLHDTKRQNSPAPTKREHTITSIAVSVEQLHHRLDKAKIPELHVPGPLTYYGVRAEPPGDERRKEVRPGRGHQHPRIPRHMQSCSSWGFLRIAAAKLGAALAFEETRGEL